MLADKTQPIDRQTNKQTIFSWKITILGFIALAASLILAIERIKLYEHPNEKLNCDISPFIACGSVMDSWQAQAFGFPNIFIGIVAFTIIVTTGCALLAGANLARWYWICLQIGTVLATVFIIWLWYQSVYKIGSLCVYCMVIWACMYPILIIVTRRNLNNAVFGTKLKNAKITQIFNEWHWIILTIIYLTIITSITIHFWEGWVALLS